MTTSPTPLVIEPEQLEPQLDDSNLLIVDLCKPDTYARTHIPGAVHLGYAQIVAMRKPVTGLLPDEQTLSHVFSSIGLTPEKHIIAYDEEGGGAAARLLWTLDAVGHSRASLLNGGLHAWLNEGHPIDDAPAHPETSTYHAHIDNTPVADRHYILTHLDDPEVKLLDSRSPEEFRGEKKFAAHAGHIPGAVNLDWFNVMDKARNLRLKPEAELIAMMEERGLDKDKTIVTYCQSHHRSALTYFTLKVLGYPSIKGYPGSWSDWGNADDTPIEI
ncbi:MAG TPA: sulfurtransferase [Gammaproteobacteria bacterium]|nr:sulfurtransferase [Gammaproteobacteria bacterium]